MIALRDTMNAASLTARVNAREADRWARAAAIAASIPPDVDLADEADVIRALYAARLCSADFLDVLDDAIENAAERRKTHG